MALELSESCTEDPQAVVIAEAEAPTWLLGFIPPHRIYLGRFVTMGALFVPVSRHHVTGRELSSS